MHGRLAVLEKRLPLVTDEGRGRPDSAESTTRSVFAKVWELAGASTTVMSAYDPWKAMGLPPLGGLTRALRNLDALLACFVRYPGLYLVGSRASLPFVPLAGSLDRLALSAFQRGSSFSTEAADQDDRTRRVTAQYEPNHAWDETFDRKLRPGIVDAAPGLLSHLSSIQAFLHELRVLALARQRALPTAELHEIDGVRVFREFWPGQIMVYNLDGLLLELRHSQHRLFDMHGTSPDSLASPETLEWIEMGGAPDAASWFPGTNVDAAESRKDPWLIRKLDALWTFRPVFVAIVGYTFARQSDGHNDEVSLCAFIDRFRRSRGNVFVIDPFPDPLCELLHRQLAWARIVPVPVMWNLLAGAYLECLLGIAPGRSVAERYRELESSFGSAGPRRRERPIGLSGQERQIGPSQLFPHTSELP
jgi:hypothetical protein